MEYSTTSSPLKSNINKMSIDPNKELFDSAAPPPASSPPPTPRGSNTVDDDDDEDAREREIEGGSGGGSTLHLSVSDVMFCCNVYEGKFAIQRS